MTFLPLSRFKRWHVVLASVPLVCAVIVGAGISVLDTDYAHRAIIHHFAAGSGRNIEVHGPMKVRVLTSSPSLVAEQVTISNPPWMAPAARADTFARIEKLSLTFDFPLPWRKSAIRRLELQGAALNFTRDEEGRGNWFGSPPGAPKGGPGRMIRSVSIPDARVVLNDARRHLQFTGTVSAQDAGGGAESLYLSIRGSGTLNGKAANFAINADPLASASHERAYRFEFKEFSTGSRLFGRGSLHRPFSFDQLDIAFDAAGTSLHDLVYLVGVTLPNSAPFTLTGKMTRDGKRFVYDNLLAKFGKSDLGGRVVTFTANGRPHLEAAVKSTYLRLGDFGVHDAQGEPIQHAPKKLLLSEAKLPVGVLRNRDSTVELRADSLVAGPLLLQGLTTSAKIEKGVLTVPSLAATYKKARVTAHFTTDATKDQPKTDLELRIADLELDQFGKKGPHPPVSGPLQAHVHITGTGMSIHELAASVDGTIAMVLPRGAMRSSLADAVGVSLRSIGLMLSGDEETPVRCALASFRAQDGKLTAEHLLIDTEQVLITGTGGIDLETEALDLTLEGHPKKMRIGRLRTPLLVHGTMAHPSFAVSSSRLFGQAGAAAAIGLTLAPVAAVLALVDPGLAKDADCATLTSQAR